MKLSRNHIVLCCLLCLVGESRARLEERYSWRTLEFAWPTAEEKMLAISSINYIPKNNLPVGFAIWKNKIFITVPRWKLGVAATLNYIDMDSLEDSPLLQPYPNWELNTLPVGLNVTAKTSDVLGDCSANTFELEDNATIISAIRVQVDPCDRLWVLDSGLLDYPDDNRQQVVPNAILVFDLNENKLIRRYSLPKKQTEAKAFFVNIVVEADGNNCNDAYAYLADIATFSMIVYSFKENRSHRIKHNFFHFDPLDTSGGNVDGHQFVWDGGIFGMALGAARPDGCKDFYFHALASNKEFKVSNCVLKNETFVTGLEAHNAFEFLGYRGENAQSTTEVFDEASNTLIYTQVNRNAIGCWNTILPYCPQTQDTIAHDEQVLIYPNDVKLDEKGYLWVLSNKLTSFLLKELNPENFNFFLLSGKTVDLLRNTYCN